MIRKSPLLFATQKNVATHPKIVLGSIIIITIIIIIIIIIITSTSFNGHRHAPKGQYSGPGGDAPTNLDRIYDD